MPAAVLCRPLLAFALLVTASAASAQCLLCADSSAVGGASRTGGRVEPLRIDIETHLDLGRVAVGAHGGEIELDPATGMRRLRGGLVDLGGFALTGLVSVRGEPGAELRVILPASVDLESGQGRTARVTGIVTDLGAAPRLGPDGQLRFRFGGRLQVDALDDGDYRGRIPVTVEYQ